jgi:hypothetical protein
VKTLAGIAFESPGIKVTVSKKLKKEKWFLDDNISSE